MSGDQAFYSLPCLAFDVVHLPLSLSPLLPCSCFLQGITDQRNEYVLADSWHAGEEFTLYIEMACNGMGKLPGTNIMRASSLYAKHSTALLRSVR